MSKYPKEECKVFDLPIIQIRPNKSQPRRNFDEDELLSLAESIKVNGILQPLTVRKVSQNEFELIAGERRLRASVLAGFSRVPCIIKRCTDSESAVFALLENLQRADLGMFEEARGIYRLINNCGFTQEQAALQLGKKQSTIANKLRLLKLSNEEQDWIVESGLTERHARALLRIDDVELRKEVMSKIITGTLNVSQSDMLIERVLASNTVGGEKSGRGRKIVIKDVRIFMNTLDRAIDTMRQSGIDAVSQKEETDEYIEYIVKIPKEVAYKHSPAITSA